jgi:hypothetical protein
MRRGRALRRRDVVIFWQEVTTDAYLPSCLLTSALDHSVIAAEVDGTLLARMKQRAPAPLDCVSSPRTKVSASEFLRGSHLDICGS